MAYKSSTIGYKGNQFLPKAGTLKNITQKQAEELEKCMLDPIYFAETYFKLANQDAEEGLVQMKLYDYQKEAIVKCQKSKRLIMATARQVGKTSVATVIILHAALFNKRKNIALLADKEATAIEVLERIQIAYEYLPDFLKGGVKEWNKKRVEFENGSKILAAATNSKSIRGKSLFLLYIDEAAHVEDWDAFSAAVLPAVTAAKKSTIIFTSTPNGMNHFYEYFQAAKQGKSRFEYVEVPWWKVDGRDEEWKEGALAELNYNVQKFAQEQEVEFLGSSGTLISGAALKLLEKQRPLRQSEGLSTYIPVEKDHQYVLIADVSRGKGLDYSAFHVIDITTRPFVQVCTFRNNMIGATDYAGVIDRIGRYYNYAQVLVELNDNGGAVIELLFVIHEYENLLQTVASGSKGKALSAGFGGKNIDIGIRTNAPVKSLGCAMIKSIVEQAELVINDEHTIEELKTFSAKTKTYAQQPTTYAAEEGKHDDLAMGLVLFGWLTTQDYFKGLTDTDILERLRERDEEDLEDYLIPFGVINTGLANEGFSVDYLDSNIEVSGNEFDNWMNS